MLHLLTELLMVEQSFKKDLEIIQMCFKELNSSEIQVSFLQCVDILCTIHETFYCKFNSFVSNLFIKKANDTVEFLVTQLSSFLPNYGKFYEELPQIIDVFKRSNQLNEKCERICRDFESCKGCFVPFTSFLLKPAFHIFTYKCFYERLFKQLKNRGEFLEPLFEEAVDAINVFITDISQPLRQFLNTVLIIELGFEVIEIQKFVTTDKVFIRKGCLLKLSKKGYQQRIFFLFSDSLVYCNRSSSTQKFKIHGTLPVKNIAIVESDCHIKSAFGFTIYSGDKALVVAANSIQERQLWIKEISYASSRYKSNGENVPQNTSFSEEVLQKIDELSLNSEDLNECRQLETSSNRSGSMTNVCWHRNVSIGCEDYYASFCNCLSGFLLRKFKNSAGWQKLWVVFTNFSLFFYKCSQDHFPLACLPLLGYHLLMADECEKESKFQFKLQFKTHVYFFKTENEYFFDRWVQALKAVTCDQDSNVCSHC